MKNIIKNLGKYFCPNCRELLTENDISRDHYHCEFCDAYWEINRTDGKGYW